MKLNDRVITLENGCLVPFLLGNIIDTTNYESFVSLDVGGCYWVKNSNIGLVGDFTPKEKAISNNSGFTRKDFGKTIITQMNNFISEFKNFHQKICASSYLTVYNQILHEINSNNEFDEDFYERVKKLIHLSDSCLNSISTHCEDFNEDENALLFGFFYSIIETMYNYESWGFINY